jgi:site-specific recombinase XerC
LRANVGDLRRTGDQALIHVRGKGAKDFRVPIKSARVEVHEHYLDSRETRIAATAKHRSSDRGPAGQPRFQTQPVGCRAGSSLL